MKIKIKYLILLAIVVSIALYQYMRIKDHINDYKYMSLKNDSTKIKMYNYIKFKQMPKLNSLLGKEINGVSKHKVVLFYGIADCSTCVLNGFEIVKMVNKYYGKNVCFVIAEGFTREQNEIIYKYDENVIFDDRSCLMNDLKYIYTPVIVFLSESNVIQDVFFVNNTLTMKNIKMVAIKIRDYIKNGLI